MNNKGFTLVELLAVVILLITISLFVMPRIVDVIKDGDKIYINVGDKGKSNCIASTGQTLVTCAGGYNGGGQAKTSDTYGYAGSGGGATHIATSPGVLH